MPVPHPGQDGSTAPRAVTDLTGEGIPLPLPDVHATARLPPGHAASSTSGAPFFAPGRSRAAAPTAWEL